MASKKLRMFLASGLLAVAAALAGTAGAALAGAPICDNVNPNVEVCCPSVVSNGAAPAEICPCPIVQGVVPANPVLCQTASPSPSETATATETASPTETATATPTATGCNTLDTKPDAFVTATPSVCPTAFQSFEGETGTPVQNTPPPTSTGSGSSNSSLPLFGLLICVAFGAIGLAAVADQRRRIRL